MVIKKKSTKVDSVDVEEVKDPTIAVENTSDEKLYTVKLDSKRFEGRTTEQVISLILGSEGVVSKVTIEREQ